MTTLHTSPNRRVYQAQRTSRILLTSFGTLFCLLAFALQCAPYPDWSSRVAAFLLLTLPTGSVGWYFLHAAQLLRQTCVVVSETGVELNIPQFRAGWLFRGVPVQLPWDAICGVQHEQQPLISGGKRIDHYWIHSTNGTFLLTNHLCRDAAEVAQLIANHKGCELTKVVPQPATPPATPAQEESDLKRNAIASVIILCALMLGIILAVNAETAVGQAVQGGLWMVSQIANLLFIVVTVVSIFGLWWSARRERLRLKQSGGAEKM